MYLSLFYPNLMNNLILNKFRTPLMLAVMNGHRDSVMLLIEQSANPNATDVNGCTAVHRGVCFQHSFVLLTNFR